MDASELPKELRCRSIATELKSDSLHPSKRKDLEAALWFELLPYISSMAKHTKGIFDRDGISGESYFWIQRLMKYYDPRMPFIPFAHFCIRREIFSFRKTVRNWGRGAWEHARRGGDVKSLDEIRTANDRNTLHQLIVRNEPDLAARQDAKHILSCLKREDFTDMEWQCAVLFYKHHKTYHAIGDMLGIDCKSVDNALTRFRDNARTIIPQRRGKAMREITLS